MTMRSWLLPLLAGGALCASCSGNDDAGPDAGSDRDGGAGDAAAGRADDIGRPAAGAPSPTQPAPRSVTLLTGDRVLAHGDGRFTVEPASGRGAVSFHTYRVRDHQYVVPGDAAPLLAAGQLDRRLFDLTLLLELGYDDAHRADVPLIVIQRGAARASGSSLALAGARVARPLSVIDGAAMRVPRASAATWWSTIARPATGRSALAARGVTAIWLDGKRKVLLDHSAHQIGAPAAWAAGYTGRGVTVAVLDTGIDATHPDFAGRIAEARSFLEWWPDATDDSGHGTHVASILAGSGDGEDGRYRGIAPEAELLIGKVCDDAEGCPESSILAGMEWAAESGAAVVNLSLGGVDGPEQDPLEEAIDRLSALHGTLFVAAAGNEGGCGGPGSLQVGSPSTADAALSVGAVDHADALASFSCRGPRIGDGAIKPDVTAPGVAIAAARAPGTPAGDRDPVDERYARLSGTSMSSPHVAGVAALLAQQHPDWRGDRIKATLMASAQPHPERDVFAQGAGRIDAARAIAQTVAASPPSVSFRSPWPHDGDALVQAVSIRNSGASAISLALRLEIADPSGAPAPDGMFAVAPAEVAVPPGGEVTVSVTADARVASPDGLFSGALVARADGAALRIPLALDKEVESHELRVTAIDRGGLPAPGDFALVYDLDTGESSEFILDDAGQGSLQLPRGQYFLASFQNARDDAGEALLYTALLVQPMVDLDRDQSIALDARLAQPIRIEVPRSSARRASESLDVAGSTGKAVVGAGTIVHFFDRPHSTALIYTAQLGPAVPATELTTLIGSIWAEPAAGEGNGFRDSPYQYNLAFHVRGPVPDGFSRRLRPAELATVHAEYAAQIPGLSGRSHPHAFRTSGPDGSTAGAYVPFRLPMTRTEYFHGEGVVWDRMFSEETEPFETITMQLAPRVSYPAGRQYHARWNRAVLGPSLGYPPEPDQWVTRTGDALHYSVSLYSDLTDRQASSSIARGASRLYRDGQLIGEHADPRSGTYQDIPPGPATYRLELEATRAAPSELSSQIQLAWTFRSERVPGDQPARLPVLAIRFAPSLDAYNRAPTGRAFAIPVAISRQVGAPAEPLRRLTVDASTDRGQTWHAARVVRFGDSGVAVVQHPAGAGLVSLRATAIDASGNSVEQVILDAYRLKK